MKEKELQNKRLKIVNIQLITTVFLLIPSFLSILILYNEKLTLEEKESLFSTEESQNLILLNRYLSLLATLIFLYTAYETLCLTKESTDNKEKIDLSKLNLFASFLIVISNLILLYIVENSNEEEIQLPEIIT